MARPPVIVRTVRRSPHAPDAGGECRLLMVKGLGTVIYPVPDLAEAKAWYAKAFGQEPYFDQPFYVGFNIAGYELGLDPDAEAGKAGAAGGVAYWRVAEIDSAVEHFMAAGARVPRRVQSNGSGRSGSQARVLGRVARSQRRNRVRSRHD